MTESYAMQFGWPGDDGLGLRLIEEVLRGAKTATFCPEELYAPEEVEQMRQHVGQVIPLLDKDGNAHGSVRLLDVAITTWGNPDERLVRGEGYATAEDLRAAHAGVWDDHLPSPLTSHSTLVAEYFELVAN